jgi:hypothetical protein
VKRQYGRTGCDFGGCGKKHKAKGYCLGHYQQFKDGRPLAPLGRKGSPKVEVVDGKKPCTSCNLSKPLDEFYRSATHSTGRQSRCKVCTDERDKGRERPLTPERQDYYFTKTYGLTLEEVEAMKAQQGGVCAICGTEPERWVVDHDHESGAVRGALCDTCNRALGLLKDNPDVLLSAAAYLIAQQDVLAKVG